MTFHLSGIILPTDELIFFRGFETNQYEFIYGYIYNIIYIPTYIHIKYSPKYPSKMEIRCDATKPRLNN